MKKVIGYTILIVFSLLIALSITLRTPWARNKAEKILVEALESTKIHFKYASLQGTITHGLELSQIEIETDRFTVYVDHALLEISLLKLLKKELSFERLFLDKVSFALKENTPLYQGVEFELKKLPFLLNVRHFIFKEVLIPESFPIDIAGYLRVGKKNRYAFLDVQIKREEFPKSALQLLASLDRGQELKIRVNLETPDTKFLPLKTLPDGKLSFQLFARGPLNSWLSGQENIRAKILGDFLPAKNLLQSEKMQTISSNFYEYPWKFSSKIQTGKEDVWTFSHLKAENEAIKLSGKGALKKDKSFDFADLFLEIEESGTVKAKLSSSLSLRSLRKGVAIDALWDMPLLSFKDIDLYGAKGSLKGFWQEEGLKGDVQGNGSFFSSDWKSSFQFSLSRQDFLQVSNFQFESPIFQATANLQILPKTNHLLGKMEVKLPQIQEFKIEDLFGHLNASLNFESLDLQDLGPTQFVTISGDLSNFYYKDFFAENLTFESHLYSPFSQPLGSLDLGLKTGKWNDFSLDEASFTTSNLTETSPFRLTLNGEWAHPLTLSLDGIWKLDKEEVSGSFQNGIGSFFNHPFTLVNPVDFSFSKEFFGVKELNLLMGNATLLATLKKEKETKELSLDLNQFPVDFFSLNPLDVSISGTVDLHADLFETPKGVNGAYEFSLEDLNVVTVSSPEPIQAEGVFKGTVKNDFFTIKGSLNAHNQPLLTLDLTLPSRIHLWPFQIDWKTDQTLQGDLFFEGRVEDFLDFFNLGTHRLTGFGSCNFTLGGTLSYPTLYGALELKDGFYQNYYTGTELEDLSLKLIASKHKLVLETFTAVDKEHLGTFSSKGSLNLDLLEGFPFQIKSEFSNLRCVQINLVDAKASGQVTIKGNLEKATARGDINITESHLTIPDKIPRNLPDLEVLYRNTQKPLSPPTPTSIEPYPFFLDLSVKAPDHIFVAGRGLDSEWKGDFHLGGTFSALRARGNIELIKGDFSLSKKNFKLKEGTLLFSGEENEMPLINLSGSTEAKGIEIIVRLKGPLNNPQVSLHSSPPLPLSSILAYLLFGQDVSDINSFQALQLVNSLTSLAGESPGVLEQGRKALGIDRVRIVTVPSKDEEEGETIAVQLGKYITEGVIVTFSQGASDAGANIGVEVELKNGFSFQVETQQQQEQGKFSIKWSHNY